MRDSRKIIILQWTVIAALVIGGGIAGFMVVGKADELSQANDQLTGDNTSLHNQLDQAKAAARPSSSPSDAPSASPSPSPPPSPSATPAASPKG